MKNTLWFVFLLILLGCSAHHSINRTLEPQYTQIANGRIEYFRLGIGSPIVLIPGYVADVSSWNNEFLNSLAMHHQLIVINNRNVGESKNVSPNYQSQDLANDVSQIIDNLKLTNTTILGISMGGMIAQQVAVLHTKKVHQLILINTAISGKKSVHPKPEMERRLLNIPKNKLGMFLVAVDSFFPPSWKMKMAFKLAFDRFQPKHYGHVDIAKIVPYQQSLLMGWAKDEITAQKLKKLPMPVLILSGGADEVLPPDNDRILANTIPNSELVTWKDGGHAMIYQYPKQIAETINTFIAKHNRSSNIKSRKS